MKPVKTMVVGVLLVTVCAGCVHRRPTGVESSPSSSSGVLTGRIGVFGGPLLPNGQMAANNSPGGSDLVSVSAAGHLVAHVTTNQDGRFSLHVPAGTYSVQPACGSTAVAVVTAGESTSVALRCDVG